MTTIEFRALERAGHDRGSPKLSGGPPRKDEGLDAPSAAARIMSATERPRRRHRPDGGPRAFGVPVPLIVNLG